MPIVPETGQTFRQSVAAVLATNQATHTVTHLEIRASSLKLNVPMFQLSNVTQSTALLHKRNFK
jgi:hypothetical protein